MEALLLIVGAGSDTLELFLTVRTIEFLVEPRQDWGLISIIGLDDGGETRYYSTETKKKIKKIKVKIKKDRIK